MRTFAFKVCFRKTEWTRVLGLGPQTGMDTNSVSCRSSGQGPGRAPLSGERADRGSVAAAGGKLRQTRRDLSTEGLGQL